MLGFAKLSRLGPGEWWLEGLRVHPDHQGRGIGRRLHRRMVGRAEEIGSGVLRFATNVKMVAVHHLARSTGFRQICGYTGAVVDAGRLRGGQPPHLRRARIEDAGSLREWLARSPYFAAAHGLYEEHWTWLELLPRLQRLLADGYVYWWQPAARPEGVIILDPSNKSGDDERPLRLSYVDAPAATLPALTESLAVLATGVGRTTISSRPLATDDVLRAYRAAGWEVKEYELWIFERPLPGDGGQ